MRYFILLTGIFAIFLVTVLNFYPQECKKILYDLFNKEEYQLATPNEYYLENNFTQFQNWTDDVSNKKELLNYIYYVINTGSEYADGECTKEYTNCITDLNLIAKDEKTLSIINNFVHPFNSFKTITFTYNEYGKFSIIIEHIYSKAEITAINYVIDTKIKNDITENMTTTDKIKKIHDFIIDSTQYDKLKQDNINDNTYKSNTAYGVLVEHYGICSGYSDTISIFLNKLGIENYKISNNAHIWNLVHINGVWAHLDTYFLITYD